MSGQKVSFWVKEMTDKVVEINGVPYNEITCNDLATNDPDYWAQQNPDGPMDLCTTIPVGSLPISGTFIDKDGNHYTIDSHNFVGGHPKGRNT